MVEEWDASEVLAMETGGKVKRGVEKMGVKVWVRPRFAPATCQVTEG
jgi:hypothetical protein